MTDEQRLILRTYVEARIIRNEDTGCWEWALSRGGHGYGQGSVPAVTGQRVSLAHRLAFLGWNGAIPEGHQIDHLCRNRTCCNPEHLEAVVQQVNIRRQHGLSENLETCAHGHRGEMTRDKRGMPFCRSCRTVWQRRYRAKKAA